MLDFVLRRVAYGLLVLLGVVVIVFFLFNVLPGDPARMMLGQRADVSSIEAINKDLGRDRSLPVQFLFYLNDLSPLSFHTMEDSSSILFFNKDKYGAGIRLLPMGAVGSVVLKKPYLRRSYQSSRKVSDILLDALPGTILLSLSSMLFATIMGLLLGILSALFKHSWVDRLSMVLAVLGMSLPSFFAGILIAWVFGFLLSDYTGLHMTGGLYATSVFGGTVLQLKNLILPTLTLGIRPLAVIVQLTRSSMLEVLSQDYIRTARAKGLAFRRIVLKHALRNALNPVVTAISGWFASLLAGAVFVEFIFGWKGVGKVTVDALEKYDLPVVMGAVLMVAMMFVIINILVDILYGLFDPRIRIQ